MSSIGNKIILAFGVASCSLFLSDGLAQAEGCKSYFWKEGNRFVVEPNVRGLDNRSCTFFEHHDLRGMALQIVNGCNVPSFRGYNDVASSVNVSPGCTVMYYEHDNYKGWSVSKSKVHKRFSKTGGSTLDKIGTLGGSFKENDSVSSAKCVCGPIQEPKEDNKKENDRKFFRFFVTHKAHCVSTTASKFKRSVETRVWSEKSCADAISTSMDRARAACKKLGNIYKTDYIERIPTNSCG